MHDDDSEVNLGYLLHLRNPGQRGWRIFELQLSNIRKDWTSVRKVPADSGAPAPCVHRGVCRLSEVQRRGRAAPRLLTDQQMHGGAPS